MIPDGVLEYGTETAMRLRHVLGDHFVGAYFVGSVALGGYVPGPSDIDVVAVTAGPPSTEDKLEVVERLSHPTHPCPARGLELVLYDRSRVEVPGRGAAFELNLNTGPRMPPRVAPDAAREPRFWFVVDRAIAHLHGVTIDGPSASQLFAPMPRPWILEALTESISWHRAHETVGYVSVLNACRAWRYAEEGILGSKDEGAEWALARWPDRTLFDSALRLRRERPGELSDEGVTALLDHVEAIVAAR